jgi:glycerophosphoryl diester phosphodiesterase
MVATPVLDARGVIVLPALYAHRLGRVPGPDSSRAALHATLSAPVDGLETDVCLTAEGRLALLHDPWLPTGTTGTGWAHETLWREVRDLRLRDRFGKVSAERPMLLEELLDSAPAGLVVQLDVKTHGDPALAVATAQAACRVADRYSQHRVEIISFHAVACAAAAKLGHRARLIVWADYAPATLAAWAGPVGVQGVCIEHFLVHAALVDQLREAGMSVTTGTINDVELARRVARLGVDAITTDVPAQLWAAAERAAHTSDRSTASIRG